MHPVAGQWFDSLGELLRQTTVTVAGGPDVGPDLGLDQGCARAVDMILAAARERRIALLAGNGGSAAIVAHMQVDLCNSVGMRAMVFHDPSCLTCYANDHGYEQAFAIPAGNWAEPGGLMVAVSSSGASPNILAAVEAARQGGMTVLTMSGFSPDNPLRRLGDLNFHVASQSYGLVETAHSCLAHYITDAAAAARGA